MEGKVTLALHMTIPYPGQLAECGFSPCLQALLAFYSEQVKRYKKDSDMHWKDYTYWLGKKGGEQQVEYAIAQYQVASFTHFSAAMQYRKVSEIYEQRHPETYDRGEKFG